MVALTASYSTGQQCQVTDLPVMVLLTWGVYLGAGFNPPGRKSQYERLKQEEKERKIKKKKCLWSRTLNQPLNSYNHCISVAPLCCGEWVTNIAAVVFQICVKKGSNATPALLTGNWGAAGLWDLSAIIQEICGNEAPEVGNVWISSPAHMLTLNAKKAFFSVLDKILCILDKKSRKLDLKVLINFNSNKLSDKQK